MSDMDKDFERDLVTLMDEEGVEHEFEVVDSLEADDNEYIALVPVFESPEDSLDDSGELVILKMVADPETNEEYLEPIDNEEEFTRIADLFMERLEEFFDFDE